MPIYHVTVGNDGLQNRFYFSGEGQSGPPAKDVSETLTYFYNCMGTGAGDIYKFDQSAPTNNGHPLHFAFDTDGTHAGNAALGPNSGVYHCGVPGTPEAFTEVNVGEYYEEAQGANFPEFMIYPFCLNHSNMGGTSMFGTEEAAGTCWSGYGCGSTCTLESYLTGVLTGLIHAKNEELSGIYNDYTITSYTIATGEQTGLWEGCVIGATGATSGAANARRNAYAITFNDHGYCYYDRNGGLQGHQNVNNASISWGANPPSLISGSDGIWDTEITGFFDKRYNVAYYPVVSGQKTSVTVDVDCPSTTLDVDLERDRERWATTGTAAKNSDIVRKLNVTLDASCSGYITDLNVRCEKVRGGIQAYCPQSVANGNTICWEDDFEKGNYIIKYVSGGYQTVSHWLIGTGNLDVSEII